jgi:hypothetical protein
MTPDEVAAIEKQAKATFAAFRTYVDPALDDLHRRLDALSTRIANLESGRSERPKSYRAGVRLR